MKPIPKAPKARPLFYLIAPSIFYLFTAAATTANAEPALDVQEWSNNTATEYFVESDFSKEVDGYYRYTNEDWGWVHEPIAGSHSSIILEVSAFDVDYYLDEDEYPRYIGERNMISVYSGTEWVDIGLLDGENNSWMFTAFDLSGYDWAEAQVNAGLQVEIDIDTMEEIWRVTLGKATLTTDDGSGLVCDPEPGIPCEEPKDSTPNSFTFIDVKNADLSTNYESEPITVTGINTAVPIIYQ